jgi:hypothetical protein
MSSYLTKLCIHPSYKVVFEYDDYGKGIVAVAICQICGKESPLEPESGPNPGCAMTGEVGRWRIPDDPFEPKVLWKA